MANGNASIMKKKMLAVFICLVMVAGLIPTVAFAAENEVDVWDGTSDTSWYNETDTEFHIKTAEQLAGLAELTNIGIDTGGDHTQFFAVFVNFIKLGFRFFLDRLAFIPFLSFQKLGRHSVDTVMFISRRKIKFHIGFPVKSHIIAPHGFSGADRAACLAVKSVANRI